MDTKFKLEIEPRITMYQRKSGGVWQFMFYINGASNSGKPINVRKSSGSKDRAEACKIALREFEQYMDASKSTTVSLSGATTVHDCFKIAKERYLTRIATRQNRVSTWKTIEKNYQNEIQPWFGSMPVLDVNRKAWNDYLADLAKRKPNLSKDYLRLIKSSLRACLNHADELIPDYSIPNLKDGMKLSANTKSKRIWFGIDEQDKLLAALKANVEQKVNSRKTELYAASSLRDFVEMMLFTGLRPEELRVLRFCDVELKSNRTYQYTIIVVPNLPGAKTGGRTTVGVKGSGAAYRRILTRRGKDRNSTDKLFDQNNRSAFVKILESLDIRYDKQGNKRDFESLRHSFISNRFLEGHNVNDIAVNVGNSPKMIYSHYTSHVTALDFENFKKYIRRKNYKRQDSEPFVSFKEQDLGALAELGEKLHHSGIDIDEMSDKQRKALNFYRSLMDEN